MEFAIDLGEVKTKVKVPVKSESMMKVNNFRGVRCQAVGNFFAWPSVQTFLHNTFVRNLLVDEIRDAIIELSRESHPGRTHNNSFEIEFPEHVGWSTIDCLGYYDEKAYESVIPDCNTRLQIMQIKKDRTDILAPLTNLVTISYRITQRKYFYEVSISSIRPGPDVGPMIGQVSLEENAVFFSPGHPCTPLNSIKRATRNAETKKFVA